MCRRVLSPVHFPNFNGTEIVSQTIFLVNTFYCFKRQIYIVKSLILLIVRYKKSFYNCALTVGILYFKLTKINLFSHFKYS